MHGEQGTLDAVYFKKIEAQGVESGRMFVASMDGTVGTINIVGVSIRSQQLFGDDHYHFWSIHEVDQQTLETYSEVSRIRAGARVQSLSYGRSKLVANGPNPTPCWGYTQDLSTLFTTQPIQDPGSGGNGGGGGGGGGGGAGGGSGGSDCDCVCLAYKRYQIALDAADATAALCVGIAMGLFLAMMAACALIAILVPPLWNLISTAICTAAALAELSLGLSGCSGYALIAINAAKALLKVDLEACGVTIVEA